MGNIYWVRVKVSGDAHSYNRKNKKETVERVSMCTGDNYIFAKDKEEAISKYNENYYTYHNHNILVSFYRKQITDVTNEIIATVDTKLTFDEARKRLSACDYVQLMRG